jgi:hypothetical protein
MGPGKPVWTAFQIPPIDTTTYMPTTLPLD